MSAVLVCPACRAIVDGALHVGTLERSGDTLACQNCPRTYPVIDGVPIVLADLGAYMRGESAAVLERDLSPAAAQILVAQGGDDAPYARLLEHVSTYVDAHWGDRASPPAPFAASALVERLPTSRVATAVELGCSAGRLVQVLAQSADHVVGIDMQFATLRRARHLLAGETLAYSRRMIGRHYEPVVAAGLAASNIELICTDALDPPLLPKAFERVASFNLLDSVHNPSTLLNVLDGLCAPGGEVLLSSPYAWQSNVLDDAHRLGTSAPHATVTRWFTDRGYTVEDHADLPWTLRRDSRSVVTYKIHYLRARKPTATVTV